MDSPIEKKARAATPARSDLNSTAKIDKAKEAVNSADAEFADALQRFVRAETGVLPVDMAERRALYEDFVELWCEWPGGEEEE